MWLTWKLKSYGTYQFQWCINDNEAFRNTVRNSKDKKGEREKIRSTLVCVSCLLGVLPLLLLRSSRDTNHSPRQGCLLSTYTTVELHLFLFYSLSTSFSLCFSSHSWSVLFHSDVCWLQSGTTLVKDDEMCCNGKQLIIWWMACKAFYRVRRKNMTTAYV